MLSNDVLYVLVVVVFDGVPYSADININIYLYIDDLYSDSHHCTRIVFFPI